MKCNDKEKANEETSRGAIETSVEWLMENEFISIQKEGQGTATVATVLSQYMQYSYFYMISLLHYNRTSVMR